LRRRIGGTDEGWHLKLLVAPGERREIRRPPGRAVRTVPVALRRLVRGFTRDAELEPIAKLSTVRTVRELQDADGAVLAQLCDDRVGATELGSAAVLSSWRELEVELVDADRSLLRILAPRLVSGGARPAAYPSKLARVLGGRVRARRRTGPGGAGSAGAVLWETLRRQVDKLRAYDPLVRQNEPDAVHQIRVATRTLRSLLGVYRPLLVRSVTDPIRAELKWLGGLLGAARDAEVLGLRLHRLVHDEPAELVLGRVAARIDSAQRGRYRDAYVQLLEALDGDRYLGLLDALDELLHSPPLRPSAARPARKVLPGRIGKAWRQLDRAVAAASEPGLSDGERAVALHRARKAAKRARYAATAADEVLGSEAVRFGKRMKKLQTVLGNHQDTVVSRELLRELGVQAHLAGENGFTYGLLYAAEVRQAARARRGFERAWATAARPRNVRWLG
jgi:CHAD domain-containing protein